MADEQSKDVLERGAGTLVRIFIAESDHWHGRPLYEAILLAARAHGVAGCTVLRAIEGFGSHAHVRSAHIERLAMDLPIVVEIVDRPDKIEAFLPQLDEMVLDGLVTLEPVHIHSHRRQAR